MVDQNPLPHDDTRSSHVYADTDTFAEAAHVLADAIRELATAIRESVPFGELEFVPCEDASVDPGHGDDEPSGSAGKKPADDAVESDEDSNSTEDTGDTGDTGDTEGTKEESKDGTGCCGGSDAKVLPLVAPSTWRETETEAVTGLCRPGGCRCDEPDPEEGRHARRDTDPVEAFIPDRPRDQTAPTGTW